jgi:hypothetical protein
MWGFVVIGLVRRVDVVADGCREGWVVVVDCGGLVGSEYVGTWAAWGRCCGVGAVG